MNMAAQQRTSQLQGERSRQEMAYATAKEGRDIETQTANMRDKDLDYQIKDMTRLRNIGLTVLESGNEEAYQSLLGMIDQSNPQSGAIIRKVAPTFNADILESVINEAAAYIAKNTSQRTASIEYDASGNPLVADIGGDKPFTITPGVVTDIRDVNQTPTAPRATPTAPMPAANAAPNTSARATQGVNTTPQDLINQGMNPNNIPSGMPTSRPVSFSQGDMGGAGQMTPDRVQQIVDSAVKTRVMAQADFDQLMAMAPEQNKQPFMDMIRANNITLQANGMGQPPQSQYADMRGPAPQSQTAGLRGAPPMEQTMAQYKVGDSFKGRDTTMSPTPGSSQVPIARVREEATARRESPAGAAARRTAELQATEQFAETNKAPQLARKRQEVFETKKAEKDADFLEKYSDGVSKGRTTLNVINQMIGDARVENGKLTIPKDGRRPHEGFESVVGAGVPGLRFIPGTKSASFDALFRQAEGGAFLQAYESLRGTGQITEIEGTKATSALTRMERSQSEVEFVKAAREFAGVIRGAVARADKRYTELTGQSAATTTTTRKTPVRKELRFNPNTGDFD